MSNGYLKMIVAAKHATAYQVESNRFAIDENISLHDLADTFYPAWEGVVIDGQAAGFMCSYNAINGVPSCGSDFLISQLMRNSWGLGQPFGGGSYVQSDCGAIEAIYSSHHYVKTEVEAVAVALNAGVDVDCGDGYTTMLGAAITEGYTTESVLDASLTRTYILQMLAGRFDPLDRQPFTQIPFEAIDSPEHQALALESALQGMVLLRNDDRILPLSAGLNIALVGPHGKSQGDLLGNYFEQRCSGGSFDCVSSFFDGLVKYNGKNGTVYFEQGCPVTGSAPPGAIDAAVALAKKADVVVMALGTNSNVAREGLDAASMTLPGDQAQLAHAVLAVGKPTIVVLLNGGTLSIDDIALFQGPSPLAIVEAFYPGEAGGLALAMQLFGWTNRWGKLSATVYPAAYEKQLPITQMSMTASPGRTYKYYTGKPLYPFGFGMSYTTFTLTGSCPNSPPKKTFFLAHQEDGSATPSFLLPSQSVLPLHCVVTVHNTGARDGDEVVQVFIVPNRSSIFPPQVTPDPDPLALRMLVAFKRIFVGAGQSVDVRFDIDIPSFGSVDRQGDHVIWSGDYDVVFTNTGEVEGQNVPRERFHIDTGKGNKVILRRFGQAPLN